MVYVAIVAILVLLFGIVTYMVFMGTLGIR